MGERESGGGQGDGGPGEKGVGGVRGWEKWARKRDSQGGGKREKRGKIT